MERRALESLSNVKPGDCIVCFSKNDIYHASREVSIDLVSLCIKIVMNLFHP